MASTLLGVEPESNDLELPSIPPMTEAETLKVVYGYLKLFLPHGGALAGTETLAAAGMKPTDKTVKSKANVPDEAWFTRAGRRLSVVGACAFLRRYHVYSGGHEVLDALIAEFERQGAVDTGTVSDSPLNVLKYQFEYQLEGATLLIKGGNYFGRDQGAWIFGRRASEIAANLRLPTKRARRSARKAAPTPTVPTQSEIVAPTPKCPAPSAPTPAPAEAKPAFEKRTFRIGAPYKLIIDRNENGLYRVSVGNSIGASGVVSEFVPLEAAARRLASTPDLKAAVLREAGTAWPELVAAIGVSAGEPPR